MNRIITISREFGSGGRELGKRLAEELRVAYYDREIVTAIAQRSELAEEYVGQIVENRIMTYYPITVASSFAAMPPTDTMQYMKNSIYNAQNETILELGQKYDCVIVGRCADYILEDYKPYNIFVYADMDSRIARCRAKGGPDAELSDKELQRKIQTIDKSRAQYYRFYTGRSWGDRSNYDICVNTSGKDIARLAKAIAYMIENGK